LHQGSLGGTGGEKKKGKVHPRRVWEKGERGRAKRTKGRGRAYKGAPKEGRKR